MNKILLSSLMFLMACSSTPVTQYYTLSDSVFRQPENKASVAVDNAVQVWVENSSNNNALVYQTTAETVHFAKNALWAEPLNVAASNAFANAMNENSNNIIYLPKNNEKQNCPCIKIDLQSFQGAYTRRVKVAGVAYFYDKNGKTNKIKPFSVEETQQTDGYDAMTNALGQAIKRAATEILR
ncbi:MAG: membrane integrity-associated transporter subunit PqiC [Neisseriaceae bacterium]|nr:membrane integrity-associated transporter subunit PqiC [Neisseriaceae bacterium]